jgi:two-component system, NarL family, response regulator DevR
MAERNEGVDGAVFTPGEQRICARLVFGEDNAEIGERVGLSEKTVKAHLTKIFRKLGASNRTEAALILAGVLRIKHG